MPKMKHLANCTPTEFLAQTVKIKHAAAEWLTKTDIAEIRKLRPVITDAMTKEEKRIEWEKYTSESLNMLFDALAEKHPKETLELLALMCFVEPEHVDDYTTNDYFGALAEMLGSNAVIGFFIALTKLARTGIFRA